MLFFFFSFPPACPILLLCSLLDFAPSFWVRTSDFLVLTQQHHFWVSSSCSASVETATRLVPSPPSLCTTHRPPSSRASPATLAACLRDRVLQARGCALSSLPNSGWRAGLLPSPTPDLASLPRQATASASKKL